ncbi:hypothetical protein [Xenorhabdus mauleonii]|uniref:hypothetical protein n=1 Tax=Xenorhabdus mauleonii TaxID=351675 RepID=UPI000C046D8D|nr:hypothetical protein [Xenorhabdus mauleonii]
MKQNVDFLLTNIGAIAFYNIYIASESKLCTIDFYIQLILLNKKNNSIFYLLTVKNGASFYIIPNKNNKGPLKK